MATRVKNVKGGKLAISDNTAVLLQNMGAALGDAASDVAEIAVEAVQTQILYGYNEPHGRPPHTEIVETGALFDSIGASVKRESENLYTVEVGTKIPYAVYVHEGYTQKDGQRFKGKDGNWYTTKGRTIAGRPFLTDGLAAASSEIEKAIAAAVQAKIGK